MNKIEFQLPDFFDTLPKDIKALKIQIQELNEKLQPKNDTIYLQRQDVADMLNVDLSTIHNWCKKNILTAYQIGGRIYFKRKEVEAAIVRLKK